MKKVIYAVVFGSLLMASVAHAEDNKPRVMHGEMIGQMTASGTMPAREMHGMRDLVMGSSTMMMPPMMGSSSCMKFNRGLALGTRGEDVKELQEMLREKGFLSASSTGFFGKMTKEAVVKFQNDGGLNPSGFFGELSRKHHEKRCGEGKEKKMGKGDDEGDARRENRMMSSTTMPVPCMSGASLSGCEHSRAFPPFMTGSGTPQTLCTTKFNPLTGRPCKRDDDEDNHSGTSTPRMMPPPATTTATTTAI